MKTTMATVKSLKEINDERSAIITSAINLLSTRLVKGKAYSARQLSEMTDGVISEEYFAGCIKRANWKRTHRPMEFENWGHYFYNSFALHCKNIVAEPYNFTYKVYNEEGELIKTYKRTVPVFKAIFG